MPNLAIEPTPRRAGRALGRLSHLNCEHTSDEAAIGKKFVI